MLNKLKDLFIPHEGNGFKPTILESVSVGVMLFLILLSFAMANVQALLWIGSDYLVSTILPAVIVDLTNEERTQESLGTLKRSPLLDEAATLKAQDMANNEYFAHYSPSGISPWYWFDLVSYDYLYAGENLAVHFTESQDVVEAWMNSPAHRANILDGNYTEVGVGTAKGEYKGFPTVFVVQLFGTQRASAHTTNANDLTLEVTTSGINENKPVAEVAPASIETIPEEKLSSSSEEVAPAPVEDTNEEALSTPEPEESIVVISDLATTSRPGVPLITAESSPSHPESSYFGRLAVHPALWLQAIYALLALFVVVVLTMSIVIEWRHQHLPQTIYAGGLLAVMAVLFYIHITLTHGATIL